MLPGYNHNVNYKGTTFHIQTEDSGVTNPHIITLLYVKGNIVARKKKPYNDILKFDRLEDVVRELMQEQHKEMLRDLKGGTYDEYIGLKPRGVDDPEAPSPPPVPPSEQLPEEKPAEKTIELRDDLELKDEDIFGADIISDKSLDEVILTYLAEDLDE